LQTQIESKKQQVETAFERLQQELGDQRCFLLARLRELEQQIWKERDEYVTKVSEEVARLGAQVEELEEKCQQPAYELLQVRDTPPPCGRAEGFPRKRTLCWGLEDARERERQEREVEIVSKGSHG
jgi:hypothetical protein